MKVMLIPGNGYSDVKDNWFSYAKKEFEKIGLEVIMENMPDPDLAREKYWIAFIEEKTNKKEDVILIGHSSGAVAIQRYMETHKIEGAILIGTCHTDLGDEKEKLSGYYSRPWQWEKMKKNAKWIMLFASQNDPYIPIEEARFIHNKLSCEYHEYNDMGHFGSDIEKKDFPELIEMVKRKIIKI